VQFAGESADLAIIYLKVEEWDAHETSRFIEA
jgi:hypothetical protein